VEAALFVQIKTDNQIKSDAEANARLEERVRDKLKRYEQRLSHVEVHVSDANGGNFIHRSEIETGLNRGTSLVQKSIVSTINRIAGLGG